MPDYPSSRSVQIPHYRCHIPRKIHFPCIQTIVGYCWKQLVPFSILNYFINFLKGTSYFNLSQKSGVALRVWSGYHRYRGMQTPSHGAHSSLNQSAARTQRTVLPFSTISRFSPYIMISVNLSQCSFPHALNRFPTSRLYSFVEGSRKSYVT